MNEKRTVVFNNLRQLKNRLDRLTMSELFALNPNRFDDFSIKYDDLLLDYSKNHIDKDVKGTSKNTF